ncbi:hypothetical protein V1478_016670 [Vespula squamosa]|uniref:Uncharacterized protein n=1 Tax=Vespula squamosa TaxID=30214 RepID=A0ABD2A0H4_VESSQ
MEGKCYCMLDNIKIRMSLAQDLCIDSNYDGCCHVQRSKPSVKTSIRFKIRYFANNKENPLQGKFNGRKSVSSQREETTFTRSSSKSGVRENSLGITKLIVQRQGESELSRGHKKEYILPKISRAISASNSMYAIYRAQEDEYPGDFFNAISLRFSTSDFDDFHYVY